MDIYDGKIVKIKDVNGGEVEVFMRPYLVKQIPDIIRVYEIASRNEDLGKRLMIDLFIADSIDVEIGDDWDVDNLIAINKELNFGKPKQAGKNIKEPEDLTEAFELLISQGHALEKIEEYMVPLFLAFQKAAINRLIGKEEEPKMMDPEDFFRKAEIPTHIIKINK